MHAFKIQHSVLVYGHFPDGSDYPFGCCSFRVLLHHVVQVTLHDVDMSARTLELLLDLLNGVSAHDLLSPSL